MVTDAIDQAVEVLNRALVADPDGFTGMLTTYAPINEALARDPTIQAYWDGDIPDRPGCHLGPLGLINGLFGTGACGHGHIAAILAGDPPERGYAPPPPGPFARFERVDHSGCSEGSDHIYG